MLRFRNIYSGDMLELEQFDPEKGLPLDAIDLRNTAVVQGYGMRCSDDTLRLLWPGDWIGMDGARRVVIHDEELFNGWEPVDEPDEPAERSDDLAAAVGKLAAEVRALMEWVRAFFSAEVEWVTVDISDTDGKTRYPVTVAPQVAPHEPTVTAPGWSASAETINVAGGFRFNTDADTRAGAAVVDELRSFG